MTDRGKELFGELLPPQRLMMTPGPSCVDPRVYRAMAAPIVGHMDPWFTQMMEDVQEMLRRVFQTQNRITFPISASGSGGIEAAVMNALDAGDECIVCINGAFSERMAIIADRIPAKVIRAEVPYGQTVDPQDILRLGKGKKIKFVGLAHGETSSGVIQRIEDYRESRRRIGRATGGRYGRDLAGVPLNVAKQGIDICFSGSQKAISAPPGMAPITVNTRVEEAMHARREPVRSWYFDLTSAMNYLGQGASVSPHAADHIDLCDA